MDYRSFGRSDLAVSMVGFGAGQLGDPSLSDADVRELLARLHSLGINLIDTARGYGASETRIGAWLPGSRSDWVLSTKIGYGIAGVPDWTGACIRAGVDEALSRLGTDYLDIAQLHSCSAEILRRGECIEGLQRAQEKGYTRYIGYSGDNADAKYAIELNVFDSLQTSVSIADQAAIDGNIPLAAEKGLGVIAKRPIANAVWRHREKPADSYHHEYWDRIQKLKFDFLNKSLEEATATALRFTLTIPGIDTMIVGTTRPQRWQENAKYVAEGDLSNEEFEAIRNRWKEVGGEDWQQMT